MPWGTLRGFQTGRTVYLIAEIRRGPVGVRAAELPRS